MPRGSQIRWALLSTHYMPKNGDGISVIGQPGLYLRLNCPTSDLSAELIYSFIKDKYVDFQFQFVEGCGKTAVQQVVNQTICLKYTGGPLIERRRAKRFQVDWQIRVEVTGGSGSTLVETGALHNISSNGALLSLAKPLSKGTRLDVYIRLPLQGKKWMKYPARVVRVVAGDEDISAAIKFDSARPNFGMPLAPA
jgi:hypothetical protein